MEAGISLTHSDLHCFCEKHKLGPKIAIESVNQLSILSPILILNNYESDLNLLTKWS